MTVNQIHQNTSVMERESEKWRNEMVEEFLEANVSEFVWIEKAERPQLPCRCHFSDCRRDHE